jgi:hypothetical protein
MAIYQGEQKITGIGVNLDSVVTATSKNGVQSRAIYNAIHSLNFITFVQALPQTGQSKLIYAVPQNLVDLDNYPIVVLYLWNEDDNEFNAVGAFSTNIDADNVMYKNNFVFNSSTGLLDIVTA